MLKIVIIEDEKHAADNIINILHEVAQDVQILSVIKTVEEGLIFFSGEVHADLIFSDVQLSDGSSFEVFKQAKIDVPVIFTTAFNEFIFHAFNYNGIDYLLKPITKEDMNKALQKYQLLQQHFNNNNKAMFNLLEYLNMKKRTRIVVKKGVENISVKLEDAVLFFTENKVVYLIDKTRKKFVVDKNLSVLETELDPSIFFRANRKYIININFVKAYKSFEKVKLVVELNLPELQHNIIVSQETAPLFRKWIAEV